MELLNMNFREFVEQDEINSRMPIRKPAPKPVEEDEYEDEDYQEPVRKVVKRVPIQEEYDEEEEILDEDYYGNEDEEYYEEPVRKVPQRPIQQPMKRPVVQRPQPQYRPVSQPVQRPIQRPIQRSVVKPVRVPGYAMPDDQFRRPLAVTQKQLKETTIEGTANTLTEAIKRKVDTVFYRFGIQGLEKLDEKILDTIEELQYPETKIQKKPLREMRRVPSKRPIKKVRPLPLEQITPVPVYEEEPIIDEEPILAPEQSYIETEYEEPVSEPQVIEEPIEEPVVEEPQPKVVKKVTSSPKPKFMQPTEEPKPVKENHIADEEEDMMEAVLSMDFGPEKKNETVESVTDDDMWDTVEAILEATPSQELKHEPQTQSVLPVQEPQEIVEEVQEQQKQKRKRKTKSVETEENKTNEEE